MTAILTLFAALAGLSAIRQRRATRYQFELAPLTQASAHRVHRISTGWSDGRGLVGDYRKVLGRRAGLAD